MLEFGIPTHELPLLPGARDRFSIFIKAAWRLFVANPRLMLFYGAWAAFFIVDRRVIGATAAAYGPTDLPLDSAWAVYAANKLVSNTVLQIIECAALATVFTLLRGQELSFNHGIAVARRNLLPLMLLGLTFLAVDLAGLLLDAQIVDGAGTVVTLPALIILALVWFYAVAILADNGSGISAAVAGSWRLFRASWRDVILAAIGLAVATTIVAAVPIAFGLSRDIEGGLVISVLGWTLFAILLIPLSAYFTAYTAWLYLFARSIDPATNQPPETTTP